MIDREALAGRQGGYCWWCGRPLTEPFAVHHRKLRKHGGSDDPDNTVVLHHRCHNLDTDSVHLQPAGGYARGFLVHSWEDPAEVPLTLIDGARVTLHADTLTMDGALAWT